MSSKAEAKAEPEPGARKSPEQERRERGMAEIALIEQRRTSPDASAKERKGVAALGRGHGLHLLKLIGVEGPTTGKERAAALLAAASEAKSGGAPAGRRP